MEAALSEREPIIVESSCSYVEQHSGTSALG